MRQWRLGLSAFMLPTASVTITSSLLWLLSSNMFICTSMLSYLRVRDFWTIVAQAYTSPVHTLTRIRRRPRIGALVLLTTQMFHLNSTSCADFASLACHQCTQMAHRIRFLLILLFFVIFLQNWVQLPTLRHQPLVH